ncbi:sensor histidine kinase [Gulosibacter sp. 10]|uniref:sensor histidine kinase n=1 Tax=Gulosibacter sp. 10 TaxID=1255570 RepID=UPI00097EC843|nr:histidine kinase [Gulosibacter sp. 10]SJM70015.1 two-component system sensor kinase [Gulosibacter sp. 10]
MSGSEAGTRQRDALPDSASVPPPSTAAGRWFRRHELLIEIVAALGILLYDAMYLLVQYVVTGELTLPGLVAAELLSLGLCVLFVVRRRSPLPIAAVLLLLAWGYVLLGLGYSVAPLVVLALLLYFLGARYGWRIVLPATIAVGVWMVVAARPLIQDEALRIGEAGMLVLADVLAAVVGATARVRRRHVAGLQELARQLARERDARALVAAAEERARIAREIHDIVAHSVGTMVVVADGASRTAEAQPGKAGAMMAQVRDTGRTAMADMRRMLDVLRDDSRPSRSPQPGLDRLDGLVGELRSTGIRVDVTTAGERFALPVGVDLAAYRIVQEAFSNARKHGGPMLGLVRLSIAYREGEVEVRVADDGEGAPAGPDAREPGGHGLVGMRERVAAYGGSLTAGSPENGGFEVRAVLPTGGDG